MRARKKKPAVVGMNRERDELWAVVQYTGKQKCDLL